MKKLDLVKAAKEINALYGKEQTAEHGAEKAQTVAAKHRHAIGKLLVRVHNTLPHGQFEKWVKANCKFSIRSARNYLSPFRQELAETDSVGGTAQSEKYFNTHACDELKKALESGVFNKKEAYKLAHKSETDQKRDIVIRKKRDRDWSSALGQYPVLRGHNWSGFKSKPRREEIIEWAKRLDQLTEPQRECATKAFETNSFIRNREDVEMVLAKIPAFTPEQLKEPTYALFRGQVVSAPQTDKVQFDYAGWLVSTEEMIAAGTAEALRTAKRGMGMLSVFIRQNSHLRAVK